MKAMNPSKENVAPGVPAWYRRPANIITIALLLACTGYALMNAVLKNQSQKQWDELSAQVTALSHEVTQMREETRTVQFAMQPLKMRVNDARDLVKSRQEIVDQLKHEQQEIAANEHVQEFLSKKSELEAVNEQLKSMKEQFDKGVEEYKELQRKAYQ